VREPAYTFLHRTVAEYLVARYLSSIPHSDRMRIVRAHQWFDSDWAEVIPMLGGLLAAEQPRDAQDLVMHFLRQRRDPLFRAFRTCLRILGESPDPDALLSRAQARRLRLRTSYLLANDVSRGELLRTLAAVPALPSAVTDALLEKLRTRRQKDWHVRRAAIRALVGRAEPAVADSLLAMAGDRHWSVRQSAIEALAGRDDPVILSWLCRRTCWPQQPSRLRIRFHLASRIADRVYHLLPPGQQARIRRGLWRLTAVATDNGRRK
jgi:hypothetical protein